MFDWLEYDKKMKAAFDEQISNLQNHLVDFVKVNGKIREQLIYDEPDSESLKKISDTPIPQKGRDAIEVGNELVENVFKKSMLVQHPRFFAFVPSALSPYSLAGSVLTDIYNLHGGSWMEAPGACMIEEKLIAWMGSLASFDSKTVGGVFLSGGSMANLSAMVIARDSKLKQEDFSRARIYFSDQTHSSNEKGLRILGFKQEQIVKISTDSNFRVNTEELEVAIKKDISEGKKPFAIIGNLGTTNTGSIDPLEKLGEIAKKYNLYFHIDGAFGGSILVSPIYRKLAKGIELADSFSWDTHKWLMQVYSCSSLIVKDKQLLLNSFSEHPEYLEDVSSLDHNDAWDLGPEMTRPHRAIKLWYTIQATGTDLLAEIVEYTFSNAVVAKRRLQSKQGWEIVSEPSCGTINFRYVKEGLNDLELDDLNKKISDEIIKSGFAYIVTTRLNNKRTLRMCMINANTTQKDIEETIDKIDEIARNL